MDRFFEFTETLARLLIIVFLAAIVAVSALAGGFVFLWYGYDEWTANVFEKEWIGTVPFLMWIATILATGTICNVANFCIKVILRGMRITND